MDAARFGVFRSEAENSTLSERMRLPRLSKKLDDDVDFVAAHTCVDEPERERSPETVHVSKNDASNAHEASEFGEIVETSARHRAPSCHSDVTDFDDLTSPGARAEQCEEYQRAVHGHIFDTRQMVSWNGLFASSPLAIPVWTNVAAPLDPFAIASSNTAESLETQADELSRAADSLMKAASQVRAQAHQIKHADSGLDGNALSTGVSPSSATCLSNEQSPRGMDTELEPACEPQCPLSPCRTTVMMRNIPNDFTREMLLKLLDRHGFHGLYNFIYLPTDFKRRAGLGYAFVNMATNQAAERMFEVMQGFTAWPCPSTKVLEVAWSEPLQGLEAHIERYRNSPVLHGDVPDKFKPMLFEGAVQVPFPPPTKRLQRPRTKVRHIPSSD